MAERPLERLGAVDQVLSCIPGAQENEFSRYPYEVGVADLDDAMTSSIRTHDSPNSPAHVSAIPEISAGRSALLAWYRTHRRDLPWRNTGDPYAVWVSEIMLQQTQVATAVPYFERWMARFPTVAALAAAPLEGVLHCWQGLGYYARARNLHRAAQAVMADHSGRLPVTRDELLRLPGIGPYTAGAVASIAFGEAVPAVDGNVRRVLARLYAIEDDLAQPAAQARIWALAEDLVRSIAPTAAPGEFNQALMELGSTVCTPKAPRCLACPLQRHCLAYQTDRVAMIPRPARRTVQRAAHAFAIVLHDESSGEVLVARRPGTGLLGGLWEFPTVEAPPEADVRLVLAAAFGLRPTHVHVHEPLLHIFTHIRLRVTPISARLARDVAEGVSEAPALQTYEAWQWASPAELASLARSTLMRKLELRVEGDVRGAP